MICPHLETFSCCSSSSKNSSSSSSIKVEWHKLPAAVDCVGSEVVAHCA